MLFVRLRKSLLLVCGDEVAVYFERVVNEPATHLWLVERVVGVFWQVEGEQVVSIPMAVLFRLVHARPLVHVPKGVLILQLALNTRRPELPLTYQFPPLPVLYPLLSTDHFWQLVTALLILERREIPQTPNLLLLLLFYLFLPRKIFLQILLLSPYFLFVILLYHFLSPHVQYLATFKIVRQVT